MEPSLTVTLIYYIEVLQQFVSRALVDITYLKFPVFRALNVTEDCKLSPPNNGSVK